MTCLRCLAEVPAGSTACPRCGPVLGEPRTGLGLPLIPRGTLLAERYTVIDILGQGGMAIVYLADDPVLERKVALKLPPDIVSRDREARVRFIREAQLCLKITHPHVVRLFDLQGKVGNDLLFLVMEYVPGPTLAGVLLARLERGEPERLHLDEVVRLLPGIAAAVDAASDLGIVHRDIKPSNVILTGPIADPSTLAKLGDFGIATQLRSTLTRLTAMGSPGTPPYMSPEQVRNRSVTRSSDVYSLAATVYHLLSGRPPFGGGVEETIHQILHEPVPPMEGVPQAVGDVLLGALAKEPSARPRTASDLADALSRAARGHSLAVPATRVVVPPTRDDGVRPVSVVPVTYKQVAAPQAADAPGPIRPHRGPSWVGAFILQCPPPRRRPSAC